jgi:hypothetical protein
MKPSIFITFLALCVSFCWGKPSNREAASPDKIVLAEEITETYTPVTHFSFWQKNRKTYQYNLNGDTTAIIEADSSYENTQWIFSKRTSFFYSDSGLCSEELIEKWETDHWVPSFKTTYSYDNKGNLSKSIEIGYTTIDTSWTNMYLYTFSYDSLGNLIKTQMDQWVNGAWVCLRTWFYGYEAPQRMIASEEWQCAYDVWLELNKDSTQYSINGLKQHAIFYSWQQGQWIINGANDYYYENDTCLSSVVFLAWQNNIWDTTGRRVYSCSSGLEKTEIYQSWLNPDTAFRWVDKGPKKVFTYDSMGNLIKEIDYDIWPGSAPSETKRIFRSYAKLSSLSAKKPFSITKAKGHIACLLFNNRCTINSSRITPGDAYNLSVLNAQGRVISKIPSIAQKGKVVFTWEPKQFASGFYLIIISCQKNGQSLLSRSLILQ